MRPGRSPGHAAPSPKAATGGAAASHRTDETAVATPAADRPQGLFRIEQSLRAICGGGRYDDLIGQMTGVDLPCVGFGMVDVMLPEPLGTHPNDEGAPRPLRALLWAEGW